MDQSAPHLNGRAGSPAQLVAIGPLVHAGLCRKGALAGGAKALIAGSAAGASAKLRRRIRLGDLIVELCRYPNQRGVQAKVRETETLFIAPLRGSAEIVGENFAGAVAPGEGAFLAKPGEATVVWRTGSLAVTVHLPRHRLQALASERIGKPLRLAGSDLTILECEPGGALREALIALLDRAQSPTEIADAEGDRVAGGFAEALVAVLSDAKMAGGAFVIARSVKAAMDHVRTNAQGACDQHTLAGLAGVTLLTLRRSFRACLGMSLATYVQKTRLEMTRNLLASGRESRSIADLARAAGFASATAFTRAYSRTFHETPTQTRVRAVREGVADD